MERWLVLYDNEVGLTRGDQRGLGLVELEFFPRYRDALVDYSRDARFPVYACPDGSGIVVEGDRFTAHGDVWRFAGGEVCKIGR